MMYASLTRTKKQLILVIESVALVVKSAHCQDWLLYRYVIQFHRKKLPFSLGIYGKIILFMPREKLLGRFFIIFAHEPMWRPNHEMRKCNLSLLVGQLAIFFSEVFPHQTSQETFSEHLCLGPQGRIQGSVQKQAVNHYQSALQFYSIQCVLSRLLSTAKRGRY